MELYIPPPMRHSFECLSNDKTILLIEVPVWATYKESNDLQVITSCKGCGNLSASAEAQCKKDIKYYPYCWDCVSEHMPYPADAINA